MFDFFLMKGKASGKKSDAERVYFELSRLSVFSSRSFFIRIPYFSLK